MLNAFSRAHTFLGYSARRCYNFRLNTHNTQMPLVSNSETKINNLNRIFVAVIGATFKSQKLNKLWVTHKITNTNITIVGTHSLTHTNWKRENQMHEMWIFKGNDEEEEAKQRFYLIEHNCPCHLCSYAFAIIRNIEFDFSHFHCVIPISMSTATHLLCRLRIPSAASELCVCVSKNWQKFVEFLCHLFNTLIILCFYTSSRRQLWTWYHCSVRSIKFNSHSTNLM